MFKLPRIQPIDLTQQADPFDRQGRVVELKPGGIGGVAYIEDGGCRLVGVDGDAVAGHEKLARALPAAIDADDAILIGEIVVLDAGGEPGADDVGAGQGGAVFAAFDLLWLDGEDLRELPLWQRRSLLETHLVRPFVDALYGHIEDLGVALFDQASALDLAGIIAKDGEEPYRPGQTPRVKIKNSTYTQSEGRTQQLNPPRQ